MTTAGLGVPLLDVPLLDVQNLVLDVRTQRGTAHVLRGVNLVVPRGRMVGVVGESGSGKSTLALAILRLLPANVSRLSGRILLDGTDLVPLPERDLARLRGRRLAMVFQDPASALNPVFTIGTQMADILRRSEPGLSRAQLRTRTADALRQVEIADPDQRLAAYPHQLSGGMRQRVMIAMALLVSPDLLLADEPTTALDATVEAGIVELFARLRAGLGGSMLFISHHLGIVAQFCDEIVVMYGGCTVESGPAAAVCAAPRHPYTAALLACEPERGVPGTPFKSIPGEVPDPVDTPPGCIFASRCLEVEARCRTEPQALRTLAPGWRAACWKAA